MTRHIDPTIFETLGAAIQTERYTNGKTHNFYLYPARFAPEIATAVITELSRKDDWILDPFIGGGTTAVEALALGRRVIGTDINALAAFVTRVRTTPLSEDDSEELCSWAKICSQQIPSTDSSLLGSSAEVSNLPNAIRMFVIGALALAEHHLTFLRQREFARCALLRLGQLALDCRDFDAPSRKHLAKSFPVLVESMLSGLQEFVSTCQSAGVPKNQITSRRLLIHRSAVGISSDRGISALAVKPRLVFTSPPYPGVHVLYHRWQYRGRRETAAPYWIANLPDGHGGAFYTAGSRSPTGLKNYFQIIAAAFRNVRELVAEDALVIQLVGFSDVVTQLPRYLLAMHQAGFREVRPHRGKHRLRRQVPNRKWYARLQERNEASSEFLLIHEPSGMHQNKHS